MAALQDLISAARCEIEVDCLLSGGMVANLLSGRIHRADVAIFQGRITGFDCMSAKRVIDVGGMLLAPGFIDGHVHIESSMVTVPEFARAVVPRGTTTVIADPHEIANVWGLDGVRYILESAKGTPLNVYAMLPTCVPATDLESSGARLDAEDLKELMDEEGVIGLAEVMNYPGVILRDSGVMRKLALAGGRRADGHAPGLTGRDLAAYIAAGIDSDHECTGLEEACEKLSLGMYIMLREGSAAKNLLDLLPLVDAKNSRRFLFVSDDRHPADILGEGHIDFMVRSAIEHGMDPITALQIASLNAAEYFGLSDLGAIAPGFRADIAVLDCVEHPQVVQVIKDGRVAAIDGELVFPLRPASPEMHRKHRNMNIAPIDARSFSIRAQDGEARVIEVIPDQIVTGSLRLRPAIERGLVVQDTERDILKIGVVERHRATGNVGLGLVRGFGLKRGALASSVAHDSHNIVVVGADDHDMLRAVLAVGENGGGLVAVEGGVVRAMLPLPIAGLLSGGYMREVAEGIDECIDAARRMGCDLRDPFMTLSFLSLSVIPELKLTDLGLVDVRLFRLVGLFVQDLTGGGN